MNVACLFIVLSESLVAFALPLKLYVCAWDTYIPNPAGLSKDMIFSGELVPKLKSA